MPPQKTPLPRRSPLHSAARLLGAIGFLGYGVTFAMIFSEHPDLWAQPEFLWYAGVGFFCYLLAFRAEVAGGLLLVVTMVIDSGAVPNVLLGYRYLSQGFCAWLAAVGLLFLLASRHRR